MSGLEEINKQLTNDIKNPFIYSCIFLFLVSVPLIYFLNAFFLMHERTKIYMTKEDGKKTYYSHLPIFSFDTQMSGKTTFININNQFDNTDQNETNIIKTEIINKFKNIAIVSFLFLYLSIILSLVTCIRYYIIKVGYDFLRLLIMVSFILLPIFSIILSSIAIKI